MDLQMSTPNDSGAENGNDSGSEFDVKRVYVNLYYFKSY